MWHLWLRFAVFTCLLLKALRVQHFGSFATVHRDFLSPVQDYRVIEPRVIRYLMMRDAGLICLRFKVLGRSGLFGFLC